MSRALHRARQRHIFSAILRITCSWILALEMLLTPCASAGENSDPALVHKSRDEAAELNQQVIELYQAGEYARALVIAQRVVTLLEGQKAVHGYEMASALSNQALILKALGTYGEAIKLLLRARDVLRVTGSADDPRSASILISLAGVYLDRGDLVEAEQIYRTALAMLQKSLGAEHPELAASLTGLGDTLRRQGKLAEAEMSLRRAVAIQERRAGADAIGIAHSLNNLAAVLVDRGKYDEAEPLFQRVLLLREKSLGAEHPAVAASLNNLAVFYTTKGDYLKAEGLYRRTLHMEERLLGPDHSQTAISLSNLAFALQQQSRLTEAESLLQRALVIQQSALGDWHVSVAASLTNLAKVYQGQGKFSQAEPLFRRALAINEAALGVDHPEVAVSLNHLASLLADEGLHAESMVIFRKSLSIYEKGVGPQHPEVAEVLNHLAQGYEALGQFALAEPLLHRALAIWQKTFGKKHPKIASALIGLATFYISTGALDRAEPLLTEALQIQESVFGKTHPTVALTLGTVADLRVAQRDYVKAESVLDTAIAMQKQMLSSEHPDVASNLIRLAKIQAAQHHCPQAVSSLEKALQTREIILNQTQSEARITALLKAQRAEEELAYALPGVCPNQPEAERLALAVALLRKGRASEEVMQQQQALRRVLTSKNDQDLLTRWQTLSAQRETLLYRGPGSMSLASYQDYLRELQTQVEKAAQDLAQAYGFRPRERTLALNRIISEVRNHIPIDGLLIEVVTISSPKASLFPSSRPLPSKGSRYLALLLLPDGRVRSYDLGDTASIDQDVFRMLNALHAPDTDPAPSASALYARLFAPLRPFLRGARKIFISLDGELLRVPFGVLLSDDDKSYLLDRYQFIYLTSGRDLLPRTGEQKGSNIFVFADPNFNLAGAPPSQPERGETPRQQRSSGSFFDRLSLPPLPGTRMEAMSIKALLPSAQLFLGADATEAALRHLRSPGILHIATHGLFLKDSTAPQLDGTRAQFDQDDDRVRSGVLVEPKEVPGIYDDGNVLSRSALALAGALQASHANDPAQDGLLIAQEAAMLNLAGTQLVVLSACETGQGPISIGQGIYGLRRAFFIAGAQSVVSSLWRVDDARTAELMAEFYRLLRDGRGRAEAMDGAARSIRRRYPHPYYWASFLVTGTDAPLSPELRGRISGIKP